MSEKNGSILILVSFLLAMPFLSHPENYVVKSVQEYKAIEAKALPGDTITWESGTYKDIRWIISKDDVKIQASQAGKTIFTGESSVEIKGSRLTFSGFQFLGGKVNGDICKVSGSHNHLSHLNFSGYHSKYYLNLTPGCQYDTISFCNFEKKPEDIQSSVVQIQADEKIPGYHLITRCSFRDHTAPPDAGGDYGIEALRIGYSFQSRFISRTTVEYCWFSRCNGDGEVISSKARENIYRYNTFENNGESHLTLRHGSDNVVYGNFFLRGAGLRIKEGQNLMVYNNYFSTGKFWAIRLENYKADPLENIIIAFNTIFNSGSINLGGKGDFQPEKVKLINNLFAETTAPVTENPTGTEIFDGNLMIMGPEMSSRDGFRMIQSGIRLNEPGYFQPGEKLTTKPFSKKLLQVPDIPDLNDDPEITLDISGNPRDGRRKSAGCFETGKNARSLVPYANEMNTGPVWLQKQKELADRVISDIRNETIRRADSFLREAPLTVTAAFSKMSAGGKHDFFSQADYWWPDPVNPDGPFIQKDGESYPDVFSDHRRAIIRLSEITSTLTSAWLLTGKTGYADKAVEHLEAWFTDTATLMNPHMLYAQAIWGRNTGRGIGLIDAYHFVEVAQSARLLMDNRIIPEGQAEKIREWFSRFLEWMTTHPYGIEEMNTKNNHSTCWVATAAAMAHLSGNEEMKKFCRERFKTVLLPSQMAEDGSFPQELRRTKPYGYSLFNIDAFCNCAELLSIADDNLWEFETPDGKSLAKGMQFIFPYIADKTTWPFAKDIYIWEEWPVRQSCLLFAGIALENEDYIHTWSGLPANPAHPEVIRNLPVRHPVIWLLDRPVNW